MSGRLAGKVAVVTGAARGIGRAVALAFSAEGAETQLLDRFGDEVEAVAGRCRAAGGGATARTLDLRDAEAVSEVFGRIEAEQGRIDILVNNAGVIFFKPIEETSVADWDG